MQALYPNAVGLKFKETDGSWVMVEKERKVFFPPVGTGWAFRNYICIGYVQLLLRALHGVYLTLHGLSSALLCVPVSVLRLSTGIIDYSV